MLGFSGGNSQWTVNHRKAQMISRAYMVDHKRLLTADIRAAYDAGDKAGYHSIVAACIRGALVGKRTYANCIAEDAIKGQKSSEWMKLGYEFCKFVIRFMAAY